MCTQARHEANKRHQAHEDPYAATVLLSRNLAMQHGEQLDEKSRKASCALGGLPFLHAVQPGFIAVSTSDVALELWGQEHQHQKMGWVVDSYGGTVSL